MSEEQDGFEEATGAGRKAARAGRGRRGEGRVGVTYKYFGAPDRATAARVPTALGPGGWGWTPASSARSGASAT